jgi:UDP-galactopyranose mutase
MITILGAGLAGLSAGYHSKADYILLEREKNPGGLSKSTEIQGYIFDYAPHILFTKDQYVMQLWRDLLKNNLITHRRQAYIHIENTFIKYPFEANLSPLSRELIKECIEGVKNRPSYHPENFEEWILTTFGEGIAKHYMIPYNQKIWKYPLDKINTDWLAGRVPTPSIEEMKKGAYGKQQKEFGPNAFFHYPKYGGIGSIAESLAERLSISYDSNVTKIRSVKNGVETTFQKGGIEKKNVAEKVLSSLPLPELLKFIDEVPKKVTKAAEELVYNSLICVNLGIDRENIIDKHWIYFPEKDIIFNRVSFPMNFSPYTTPDGKSSILVEITFRDEFIDIEDTVNRAINDLIKTGIINKDDNVEVCDATIFDYAYVIYDLNHNENVGFINKFLFQNNIVPIGRFGEWEYYNMDKAILSGKKGIERIRKYD